MAEEGMLGSGNGNCVPGSAVYDRFYRNLHGLPDVTESRPATVNQVTPVEERPLTYIVRTLRHRERGDFILIEYISHEGAMRIVLPPGVANRIASQRESLTTQGRRKRGKEEAARRKAQGIVPGFMKGRARKTKAKKGKPLIEVLSEEEEGG